MKNLIMKLHYFFMIKRDMTKKQQRLLTFWFLFQWGKYRKFVKLRKQGEKTINCFEKTRGKWIKQLFCRHNYIRLDDDESPETKYGEMVNMIRLHKCNKCGKEKMIGSGWIC
jgi:hypothetical protein